jgi:transposase
MASRPRSRRDKLIAELRRQLAERDRLIAEQRAQIAALVARVAELEAKLAENSSNSSRPPSSDPPGAPRPPQKAPTGRKPGGQPGHRGVTRVLLPPDRVTRTVVVKPDKCRNCGAKLCGHDEHPERHQVIEAPKPRADVTEWQMHGLDCGRCGVRTRAALPEGVPAGAFGPRLLALVSSCTGVYRLSKRTTANLLEDLFDVPMALGSVTACEQAMSATLGAPVAEAHAYVQQQPVVHADETGWREALRRAWLWVAATQLVTVFMVHSRRGAIAARALLGEFKGILVTDRWSAYNGWKTRLRQVCWAHLLREFTSFSERAGAAGRIGRDLLAEVDRMFDWWYRVRDGTLARSSFREYMKPLRRRVRALLEEGRSCDHAKTAGTCREILKLERALWTFVRVPGVEPTNNAAERAIRPGVLWRKGSFGTHSPEGSRFVERMMTVAATLKQQGRNIIDYLTQAAEASLRGEPAPSLLPVAAAVSCVPGSDRAAA